MSPIPPSLFSRYPPHLHPIREPAPLGNAGGLSGSRLWRFVAPAGEFAARAWPEGRFRDEVQTLHGWIRRAEVLGFVPVPRDGRDGRSAQELRGTVWEIAPWMPGSPDLAEPPSPEHVMTACRALGALHRAWGPGESPTFSPGLAARAREIEALPRNLEVWRREVASRPRDQTAALALQWIDAVTPRVPELATRFLAVSTRPVPVQTVLRDARPDHFLFTGDRLTGLIDFGAMGVDAVAADLARLLFEWRGLGELTLQNALAAYETQRPLHPAERDLIPAFGIASALLGGTRWIRWNYLENRDFGERSIVQRGLRNALARLAAVGAVER